MILAGDVGGTHTRLALFEPDDLTSPQDLEVLPSQRHGSLDEMVTGYMARRDATLDAACFGIAGPVRKGRSEAVNLAWSVDSSSIAEALGLDAVRLVNDLQANALGVSLLGDDDLLTLHESARDPEGNAAVLSPGTGLGEALLIWDGTEHIAVASEGGHTDFAPRGEDQAGLLRFLAAEYGHVSYERVCSGMGLVNIHRYLRHTENRPAPDWLTHEMSSGDEAAAISGAALDGTDEIAGRALSMMVDILASKAANLALTVLATGGIFIGGGIPPRILPWLQSDDFVRCFVEKGRHVEIMKAIPAMAILNDHTALYGAARGAVQELAGS